MRRWFLLLVVVAAACASFTWIGLPTPMLFGGLAGALVYALARPAEPLSLAPMAFTLAQASVGVVVGTSIEWAGLVELGPRWMIVVIVSVFSLVVSVFVGQLLIRRGATPVTATFSSIAGGAAGLTAMADDLGADARVVAVLQYLRLLVVLVTMPIVVGLVFGATSDGIGLDVELEPWPVAVLFVVLAAAVGLWLGRVTRMPSAAILGPLAVASLLTLLPLFDDVRVPEPIQAAGYLVIGVQIGLRFTVASLRSISRMVPVALFSIVVTLIACAGLAWVLVLTTDASPLDAYLATTPGGIYAVMGTSAATGGDVTFVAATQVLRLLIVLASAPFLAAVLRRRRPVPDMSEGDGAPGADGGG